MLRWLRRRRERIERIEADAEALIRAFGAVAYAEARRCRREASGPEVAAHYSRVSRIIARRTGKNAGLDAPTWMALVVDFTPRRQAVTSPPHAPLADSSPMDELVGAISDVPQRERFRFQFLGVSTERGLAVLKEVDLRASDGSEAIREAAHVAWPPRTIGFHLIDREGREVFGRLKADRR